MRWTSPLAALLLMLPQTAHAASDAPPNAAASPLPPEEMQRVVHASDASYRRCYEQGLARRPTLAGRIAVQFVLRGDGHVESAESAAPVSGESIPTAADASDAWLPDAAVVACVVDAVASLVFPQSGAPKTKVTAPFRFSPPDAQALEGPSSVTVRLQSKNPNVTLEQRSKTETKLGPRRTLAGGLSFYDVEWVWNEVCHGMCPEPLDATLQYRVAGPKNSPPFMLPRRPNPLTLVVDTPSSAVVRTGQAFGIVGSLGSLVGVAGVATGASQGSKDTTVAGIGILLPSAALLVTGVILWATSHTHVHTLDGRTLANGSGFTWTATGFTF